MALLDMMSGARGGRATPLATAILGLLAYRTVKGFEGVQTGVAPQPGRFPPDEAEESAGWLKAGLGEMLAGDRAGPAVSGGLEDLVEQFEQAGEGDVAHSWVDTGANKAVTPQILEKVLTTEQIATLSAGAGLSRDQLLAGVSRQLPNLVDHLTPDGHIPSADELAGTK